MVDRLRKSYNYAQGVFRHLSVEDLSNQRISERDGKPYTIAWALLHALEHTGIHLGHLQILRQMWEMRDNQIQGE